MFKKIVVIRAALLCLSAAVANAQQLAGQIRGTVSDAVDYADRNGFLLISNDPYSGVAVDYGKIILPKGPGLGLKALT